MIRLLGLAVAVGLGLWAQRILTGPKPGIPRDALILFLLASVVFVASARMPRALRAPGGSLRRPWRHAGLLLSATGIAVGLISLVLLWRDLGSVPGLILWPLATGLFLVGTFLEEPDSGIVEPTARNADGKSQIANSKSRIAESRSRIAESRSRIAESRSRIANGKSRIAESRSQSLDLEPPSTDDALSTADYRSPLQSWLSDHWDILILVVILLVALGVRVYQLDTFPNGCQSDECNNGLDAVRWLQGAPYRPYAETNEGQTTFFTYLISLSFSLFGIGVTQMRLASALAGVLTVVAFYFLARELYGRRPALVAAALLATARWHVTFSRIVYELILQPLFMVLLVFFLVRGLRTGRRRNWALAGVALAAGLNTYTAFRVVPIILVAFLVFWILRTWFRERDRLSHDLEGMAVLVGGALTAILPLGVYIMQNWSLFTSRIRHVSVIEDVERAGSLQPVIDNLRKTLYMFNWQGDNAALNNLPGAPMFDTLIAVLFVLALAYSLWYALRARSLPVLYVLWFLGIASLAVLSVAHEAPTSRRTIGMIPLAYLWVALCADQFFLAWRGAWRGMGERALNWAVVVAVALIAFANARAYFHLQAPHPDVWNAHSPAESAIGEYVATLPPEATVLITPQYEHHSAIKLISLAARGAADQGDAFPYEPLNPIADVPYRQLTEGDLVYLLEPVDRPLVDLLQQVYPGGQVEEHEDRYGRELFLSYTVPNAELTATQGLTGQFFSSHPPTQAPEARQPVETLDLDMRQAPLAAPYFVVWEGTLLVPEYGAYTFDLLAEGEAASLQLGSQYRLDLAKGGAGRMATVLPAGFHPLRLEFQSGVTPGRLRLDWQGPGFGPLPVDGDALLTANLGGQGLVGYYYPNAQWLGEPALVRNDPLIVPNNPLREPFSIAWRGKIAIPVSGTYVFGTRSDDGSFVTIDDTLVVDNGGSHGAQDRQGEIYLEEGFHDIEVRYFDVGGSREMQLWWQPPGQGRAVVDSRYLFPLEGEAMVEDLALPSLPEIGRPAAPIEEGAEDVLAREPASQAEDAEVDVLPVRATGELPALEAELLWSTGTCEAGDQQLSMPRGVAVDPNTGEILLADAGSARIIRLSAEGEWLDAWGQPGEAPDQFQEPYDLVLEPLGTVVVLDAVGQRLLRFTPEGQFLETLGSELALYRPRGLASDAVGDLYVADTGGVRIVTLDANGNLVGQVGGRASDMAARQPTDVAVSSAGDLYYVEAENGAITLLAADAAEDRWSGPLPANTLDGPHLAWLDRPGEEAGGTLYVSDPEGRRVLAFDGSGRPVGQFGGEAALDRPVGIAVRSTADGDQVVVADSQGCRVVAFRVLP